MTRAVYERLLGHLIFRKAERGHMPRAGGPQKDAVPRFAMT